MTMHVLQANDLAAVLRVSKETLHYLILLGKIPPADCRLPKLGSARGWNPETISAISPEIAERLELPIVALAQLPAIKL